MKKLRFKKDAVYTAIFCIVLIGFIFPSSLDCQNKNNSKYNTIINSIAKRHRIPQDLIKSIIRVESNFNNKAVSPKGAKGLMQLMPAIAKKYGVKNVFDPKENIEGGIKYLKDLMKIYKSQTNLVLAAYNAGEGAVKKHNGIPPFPETINYVRSVKKDFNKSIIRSKTQIYKFYNSEGRLVLTDNPRLKSINSIKSETHETR